MYKTLTTLVVAATIAVGAVAIRSKPKPTVVSSPPVSSVVSPPVPSSAQLPIMAITGPAITRRVTAMGRSRCITDIGIIGIAGGVLAIAFAAGNPAVGANRILTILLGPLFS